MKQTLITTAFLFMFFGLLQAQTARIQVIHNSPDPTVDVYAGPQLLLDNFAFRTASGFVDVPAGISIPIGVAPASSTSVSEAIFTQNVTFESGKTYVVTASGVVFNTTTPFGLIANGNGREAASSPSKVDVAVLHGSPDAPDVDVAVRGVGNVISNLAYGSFTPYLSLDPGVYYLDVKAAGSNAIVQTYKADLAALAGKALYVFASGYLTPGAGAPFGLYAALANGDVIALPTASVAAVQVIHNSPSPTVDVYANGDKLLEDFAFRTAIPFTFLPAGVNIDLAVAPATSTSAADAIANFNVNFENGKTYVVTASGIVGSTTTPFTLNVNDTGRQAATSPAKTDVAILHGSPNAPGVDVDEILTGNIVSNLAYGSFTPYLSLDPGIYDFVIRATGTTTTVATYRANLSGLAGRSAYVFASGLIGSATAPFGLYAALANGDVLALGATPFSKVQIIHNSPSPTVDVYAGQARLLNNFVFRTATPFVDVPAGRAFNIGIAPEGSATAADAIASFPVTLDATKKYIVTAAGIVGNATTPFNLYISDNAEDTAPPSVVRASVFHGSPDAPAVDVAERLAGVLVPNIAFGQATGYLNLPPDEYFLDIKPAGSSTIVATFAADLSALAGQAIRIMASGNLAGSPDFGLYAVLANGNVVEIPAVRVARLQIVHNSPSPTVDVYLDGEIAIEDFEFQTATPFIYIPADVNIEVGVAPGGSQGPNDIIATFNVLAENGKSYYAIASGILGNTATPFTIFLKEGARETAVNPAKVELMVHHGIPDAPPVNLANALTGANVLTNVPYGTFSNFLAIDPDVNIFDIAVAANPAIVAGTYGGDFEGANGIALLAIASGQLGTEDYALLGVLPDGEVFDFPSYARAQVIHNAPSPVVDVYFGELPILSSFEYLSATETLLLPAATPFELSVAPENSSSVNDAIYSLPVSGLKTGRFYTVMAAGEVGGTPAFGLFVQENPRNRALTNTDVDLAFFHGAPNAPEVDITGPAGVIYDNVAFGEYGTTVSIPAASYIVNVTPANDNNTIVAKYLANLTGTGGQFITVFAAGYLNNTSTQPAFGAWAALTDGTVFPLALVSTSDPSVGFDKVVLSPNPATSTLQVQMDLNQGSALRYRVLDLNGKLMQEGEWGTLDQGTNVQAIQVDNLQAGMYQLELLTAKGSLSSRFVKF